MKWPTSVAASTGQVLVSDTAGNLSWSTASSGAATSYSGILPVTNGGTNSSAALNNNRIMVSSAGALVEAAPLTNGQLLIGSTGSVPVAAAITGGTGISVLNAAGNITISATASAGTAAGDLSGCLPEPDGRENPGDRGCLNRTVYKRTSA